MAVGTIQKLNTFIFIFATSERQLEHNDYRKKIK